MVCKKCGGEISKAVTRTGVIYTCKKCGNMESGFQPTSVNGG